MLPPSTYARRRPVLPMLLFSAGLGICMYFGQEWYQLPKYSESDIEASTELNLKMDLQHRGPNLQPANDKELDRLRAEVRYEITSAINAERDKVTQRFSIGLVAMILGFGQLVMEWMMRRKR